MRVGVMELGWGGQGTKIRFIKVVLFPHFIEVFLEL